MAFNIVCGSSCCVSMMSGVLKSDQVSRRKEAVSYMMTGWHIQQHLNTLYVVGVGFRSSVDDSEVVQCFLWLAKHD